MPESNAPPDPNWPLHWNEGDSHSSGLGALANQELRALKELPRAQGEAAFFYYDQSFRLNAVKVLPGEYFVTHQNMVILTVLGSCISVCIWDSKLHLGGMNHFMLPSVKNNDVPSGKYGDYAMELLIAALSKQGSKRENMQAKVFGGGQVTGFTKMNIGEQNAHFVFDYLIKQRIHVVSQDVLDIHPRKVCFFPVTGKALVKKFSSSSDGI